MPAASVMSVIVVKSGERRKRRRTCLSCCEKECMGAPRRKNAGRRRGAALAGLVWLKERYEGGWGEVRGDFAAVRAEEKARKNAGETPALPGVVRTDRCCGH